MVYRFSDFTLDTDRFELSRGGVPIALQPKALRLLMFLLEHRDRAPTKIELLDVLWEGTAVTESSLTRAVALARAAVGESGDDARILRTVHGVGYRIGVEVSDEEPGATPARLDAPPSSPEALLVRPAVAVLPFREESGEADQEYLGEAIAEGTISALAAWRWFPVIARKASFRFREPGQDPARVGRELGARYLVDGRLRRQGDRIRLHVELVDSATAEELWSGRFDASLADLFDVQDEIADRIATGIEPRIGRAETRRVLRQRSENLDAWDSAVRALWHVHRGGREEWEKAHRLLDRAIALDPASSYAHSILALCCFEEALLGWAEDPRGRFTATYEAARRAVELDADDWLAHALYGLACLWTRGDYDAALAEVRTALDLNPSASIAYQFLGCVLEFAGEPQEAIRRLEACLRLDPRYQSTSAILADIALCNLILRDLEAAIALAGRAVTERTANLRARQRLVSALAHAERLEEARRELSELRALQPGVSITRLVPTYPFRRPGDFEYFFDGLRAAGLE